MQSAGLSLEVSLDHAPTTVPFAQLTQSVDEMVSWYLPASHDMHSVAE